MRSSAVTGVAMVGAWVPPGKAGLEARSDGTSHGGWPNAVGLNAAFGLLDWRGPIERSRGPEDHGAGGVDVPLPGPFDLRTATRATAFISSARDPSRA